jgi:hypothetical protein
MICSTNAYVRDLARRKMGIMGRKITGLGMLTRIAACTTTIDNGIARRHMHF